MAWIDQRTVALNLVSDGAVSQEAMLLACLNHMSQDDVRDMMEANQFVEEPEDEDDTDVDQDLADEQLMDDLFCGNHPNPDNHPLRSVL